MAAGPTVKPARPVLLARITFLGETGSYPGLRQLGLPGMKITDAGTADLNMDPGEASACLTERLCRMSALASIPGLSYLLLRAEKRVSISFPAP